MTRTPTRSLTPRFQVWITAVALVVGFLCGMMVFKLGYFEPGIHFSITQLERLQHNQQLHHEFISRLRKDHPEVYDQIMAAYDPETREALLSPP